MLLSDSVAPKSRVSAVPPSMLQHWDHMLCALIISHADRIAVHCANRPLSAFSSPPPCSSPAPACSYVGSLVWLVLASALLVQACMYWTHLINPTIIFTSIVSPMVGGGLGCGTEGVLGPQTGPRSGLAVQPIAAMPSHYSALAC
jgi:hypothetical protein